MSGSIRFCGGKKNHVFNAPEIVLLCVHFASSSSLLRFICATFNFKSAFLGSDILGRYLCRRFLLCGLLRLFLQIAQTAAINFVTCYDLLAKWHKKMYPGGWQKADLALG
jgi:hypothetical protein